MRKRTLFVILAVLAWSSRPAFAQTKACDGLKGPQREVARAVLERHHPYDCCDDTITRCLQKKPVCRLAERLADQVCRLAAKGESREQIERELERRASSALAAKRNIDLGGLVVAGDPGAKVTIVAYSCARCPYCAKLIPALHQSVTSGRLKGKAKLYVKAFPIRSHQHSTEGAMAWMAAEKLGHFWDMLLHMYANFDRFDPTKLPDCAASKGMDRERFRALLGDAQLRERLVASKKEGLRNKVDATPAIFIDGRRYLATLDQDSIEDFVEEQLERGLKK